MRQLWVGLVFVSVLCVGCSSIADRERVDRLVATIDDNSDVLHAEDTPSVRALINVGLDAVPRMLDLMESQNALTRLRAHAVLEGISAKMYGFVPGQGWSDPNGEERWHRFWADLGNLDDRASAADRARSIALWRVWYRPLIGTGKN
jgi:hypothetical protein